jgi:hypothetical protein
VRQNLTELHAVAFVDEHIAHAPDEIESELHLTTALDGRAPEHFAYDVAAVDDVVVHGYRSDGAVTHDERDDERKGQNLQPADVPSDACAKRARRGLRGQGGRDLDALRG